MCGAVGIRDPFLGNGTGRRDLRGWGSLRELAGGNQSNFRARHFGAIRAMNLSHDQRGMISVIARFRIERITEMRGLGRMLAVMVGLWIVAARFAYERRDPQARGRR